MNRVAIYLRSALEDKSVKIEQQSLQLRKYATEHGGTVVGIYVDNGSSGCRMFKRHSLKEMLRHCKRGKVDNVLVLGLSHLARQPKYVTNLRDKLQKYNVTLTSVDGGDFNYAAQNILSYSMKKLKGCM